MARGAIALYNTFGSARRGTRRRNVMHLITTLRSFVRRDEGQDLLEYALLVALIALVAVGAVTAAGTNVAEIFNDIAAAL
jgi:pilus assembly protein Flp/PilA